MTDFRASDVSILTILADAKDMTQAERKELLNALRDPKAKRIAQAVAAGKGAGFNQALKQLRQWLEMYQATTRTPQSPLKNE